VLPPDARPLLAVKLDPLDILKFELETVRIEVLKVRLLPPKFTVELVKVAALLNVMELLRLTVLFSKVVEPVKEKLVMLRIPPLKVHPAQEPVEGSAIVQPAGMSIVQAKQLLPPTRVFQDSPSLVAV
jgi:hypothetical protein